MNARILKLENEYQAALHEAENLVALDPEAGTREADRLELLALLIEDYEQRSFSFEVVDPVDAIEFRMAEQGLRQRDLVPMLGSRSRVSEVLARKRPLTVQMVRSLAAGLGIPAEALIAEPLAKRSRVPQICEELNWKNFPVKEMEKRGWFQAVKATGDSVEEKLRAFLSQVVPKEGSPAFYRRRFRGEEIDEKAYYSALAWSARVLIKAKSFDRPLPKFEPAKINPETLRDLARLSWFENGPNLAVEFLAKCGIATVVERRLANAVIDGAAMLSEQGVPVIGLTLRIDRIDYFWFTLLHEVVHIWKHIDSSEETYIDRIDKMDRTHFNEKEADRIARDAFVRRAVWERSAARLAPNRQNIQELADELHVHPAIVVGRLQFETGRYESFRDLLGQGTVRAFFPETLPVRRVA